MTAREKHNEEFSPVTRTTITSTKKVPVEQIKLGTIKLQSAMDLENDDGTPQV
jgi:hypothetical protein